MPAVRSAAVAGTFYPDDAHELNAVLAAYLAAASTEGPAPKAIIVPHAGLVYSGGVAGQAYSRLLSAAGIIRRVVLIGPSHRVAFRGVAASAAEWFETPLGRVPVDREGVARVMTVPGVQILESAHAREHALEVQLPFLQRVLKTFDVVPLVVGQASRDDVVRVLDAMWGGAETLVVISSDLSHYLPYGEARQVDGQTATAIESLDFDALGQDDACGRLPIAGLLAVARRRQMRVERLDLRNSGDTAGSRDAVVGYGAWAFHEPPILAESDDDAELSGERRWRKEILSHAATLIDVAKASVRHGVQYGCPLPVAVDRHRQPLRDRGASFVTLRLDGQLRGCIGSPAAWRPLIEDVTENAFRAAFRDPRFLPVGEEEHGRLAVSIAVLTPPEPLRPTGRDDLLRHLRPGLDGLIVEDQRHRALFLPSVWEQLPEPEEFLAHLLAKAGLSPGHWSPTLTAHRFASVDITAETAPITG